MIHKQRASFSTISLSGNVQIVLIGYKSKVRKISTNRQDEQRWLALLLDARAMSKVKRFFKGINTEKLELMVAEATQGIHETDQKLACLRQELEVRHTTLFQRKQKKQFCEEAFNRIQIELNTPSNAVNHIQRLSEQVNVYQRYLRDIVATHERQQQANQQESQNLAAQRSVLEKQLAAIDQQLRDVEQSIVAQARVVVAPIVTADTPIAKKWLGRDLFGVRGISLDAAVEGINHSVMLDIQSRMHPQISVIAIKHVYGKDQYGKDRLKNGNHKSEKIEPLPESSVEFSRKQGCRCCNSPIS